MFSFPIGHLSKSICYQYRLISIPFLFSSQEYMDFLSVHMEYDCTTETSLTKAVTEIQVFRHVLHMWQAVFPLKAG